MFKYDDPETKHTSIIICVRDWRL